MYNKNQLYLCVSLLVIVAIAIVPNLNKKNKFRLSLVLDGTINKFLILLLLLFLILENVMLGVLVMILFFVSINYKDNTIEGFRNYYD